MELRRRLRPKAEPRKMIAHKVAPELVDAVKALCAREGYLLEDVYELGVRMALEKLTRDAREPNAG